jgi:D-tyrosyl-tRNA(Tyr) deacylase
MRAVIQRVSSASVSVDGETVGEIGVGLVVLLGVGQGDGGVQAAKLAGKIARLRVFDGESGRMDRSLQDVGGAALCISQFTLYGDTRRGLRPSFTAAADPADGRRLYESFCHELEGIGVPVAKGVFGARMSVEMVNEGPVTLLLEA